MKHERNIIGGLLLLQLILWLGFLVHRSPQFPASLAAGVLGITAALLMVVPPLLYSAAKRNKSFREKIKKRISIGALLSWHVYTSIIGSILAILHTGHRFESPLGIWLTAMMLLTVLSGFVGRYYLAFASGELKEKQEALNKLAYEYNRLIGEMAQQPNRTLAVAPASGFVRRTLNSLVAAQKEKVPLSRQAVRLAGSIADLEYAIKTHQLAKRRTKGWLNVHIATSVAFYILLVWHIWSQIYYGITWFR